jgi:uncharacterized protein (TIGR02246 family)
MNRYAMAGIVTLTLGTALSTAEWQAGGQEEARAASRPSLERRLQALEDKEAIRELLVAYGRDFDRRDFTAYAQLFAADGVWTGGSPGSRAYTGPEAIREFVAKTYPPSSYPGSFHIMSSPSVQMLDENTATAWSRWTYVVLGVHGEPAPLVAGHYEDTLVREGGAWKFKLRKVFAESKQP